MTALDGFPVAAGGSRPDEDPSLEHLDFATRRQYLAAVEELCSRSGRGKAEVLAEAARLVPSVGEDDIGVALLGDARPQLEARLGARPPMRTALARLLQPHAGLVYVVLVVTLAAAITLCTVVTLRDERPMLAIVVAILAWLPALAASRAVSDALLMAATFPPRPLPKLDCTRKAVPGRRTAVVYPVILATPAEVDHVLANMEANYLRNPLPGVIHCILADGVDSSTEHAPQDPQIAARLAEGVRELSARQPRGVFYAFARARRYNARDEVWMGWERKRGKLLEFARLVLGHDTSFEVGAAERDALRDVAYVLTLDADTLAPEGVIGRLVGARAHPLNRPRFEPGLHRVCRGHGIIAPRVAQSAPAGGLAGAVYGQQAPSPELRPFAWQDFLGEQHFLGKGIFDVEAFVRALDDALPDNAILSHDKLEGMLTRAAIASEVVLQEHAAASWMSFRNRTHRWVRGDFQLLPWVLPWAPSRRGWRRNALSAVHRFQIGYDALIHLRYPAVAALLVGGWLGVLPGNLSTWTVLVLLSLGIEVLVTAAFVLCVVSPRRLFVPGSREEAEHPPPAPNRAAIALGIATRGAAATFVSAVFLLDIAFISLDATIRTSYRMLRGRRLLEWTPAAHADREIAASRGLRKWRALLPSVAVAAALAAMVVLIRPMALPYAGPWLALWLLAPLLARWPS